MIRFYKVGGCVRDMLLKVPCKDIDYAVEASSFEAMESHIASIGKIFLSKPEYQTVRAMVNGEPADYVLCRKDGVYTDGRRPDSVTLGTIDDDLARRDFTVNAMAMDDCGVIYDPHNGWDDIDNMVLRCVGSAKERFTEDSLRMLRAIRFHITKGFDFSPDVADALQDKDMVALLMNVSEDRIREELHKCFAFSTMRTLDVLYQYNYLATMIFSFTKIWLEPTMRKS